ncbi:2OG-Fe(II) oxygenase [Aquabacterium sp. OR-4]|uniref:2OG-Fe(II) oxygenase n=1 Tax=Aquabacterium sp. OR-4 TaxID=2978127 RepID=UPI0021B33866|nr:2OG-Fe(II) oxygenase [Aquabacterium sp. OR-4]MDT7836894.1 2OG-Fe(II) oxygenase [Aquabacterium sp. OR-4]
MTTQTVTPELRQWIIEQARAGCRPEDVLEAMRSSGWDEDVAIAALEQALAGQLPTHGLAAAAASALAAHGRPVVQQPQTHQQPLPAVVAVPEPDLRLSPARLWAHDREVAVLAVMQHPRVVVFGGLLSDDECDAMVAAAGPRMARSETVVYETGGNEVNAARTSEGMFFGRAENALCERIEARIAALLRWPVENGEGLQVLHYRPGAEYKPHHDYFDPAQPGMAAVLRRGGQRVATVVMYLNTPEQGGATTFPDVGLEVAPVKGHAVFFSYDRAHPVTRTLHGGAPVIRGDKWVATKWLREREFV